MLGRRSPDIDSSRTREVIVSQRGKSKGAGKGRPAGKGKSASGRGGGGRPQARGRSGRGSADSGAGHSGVGRSRNGLGGDQIEGRQAVRELLLAGNRRIHEVVVSTDRKDAPVLDDIFELAGQLQVPVRELGRQKLSALARTDSHQGVVATCAPLRPTELADLAAGERGGPAPFLLATDGVTDPGNLGALLRTAVCAGVTGVVLPRHRAVHITPSVAKAAAGAIEHLRFAVVGGLPTALADLDEAGVVTIGLDASGDTSIFDLPPATGPVAVVVGAEGQGLGRLTRQRCTVVASIPQAGPLDSLNVSVAGALALYEVVRQRSVHDS